MFCSCTLVCVCLCVCVCLYLLYCVYGVRFVCLQSVAMFVWFVVMKASSAIHDEILSNPFFPFFFSFVLLFGTHTHSSPNTGYSLLIHSVLMHRPCLNQFFIFRSFVHMFATIVFTSKVCLGSCTTTCACAVYTVYTIQNTQFCLSDSMGLHCLTFTFTHQPNSLYRRYIDNSFGFRIRVCDFVHFVFIKFVVRIRFYFLKKKKRSHRCLW